MARGVKPDDAVILLLENRPAFLITWFACARVGAVAVGLNSRYASDEIAHALGLTGGSGIIALADRCRAFQ
jgi:carnitine-CoA ligase